MAIELEGMVPKIEYVSKRFSAEHMAVIEKANEICEDYAAQGYDLTLRQMYYQFVSRDLIANNVQSYKRLGSILNDARLAGLIDWDAITDRTRNLQSRGHWSSPQSIVAAVANQFHKDLWATQETRVEVWIEKDALSGVIAGVCNEYDVPYFSCRGYTSQSEVWTASQRIGGYLDAGQECEIIHLGDHDPSGIDMSRDIADRLWTFVDGDGRDAMNFTVNRIALNEDQIQRYNPPPNPAKLTDSRAVKYLERFGNESWELDALAPNVITDLIRRRIERTIDPVAWAKAKEEVRRGKQELQTINANYGRVVEFLEREAS